MNGYHPLSAYKRALKPNGRFVHVGRSGTQLFQTLNFGPFISMTSKKEMRNLLQRANQNDLIYLKELLEDEKIKPVIDRRYKINEVQEAFRYFAEGHAQGKVIITI
ncbi:zinc-binding dehydrogenase [Cytobacillus praedii]|uniref:zinc-binding dehydrogenase n=1 Tax=Cytobacillus praedii TaxID=1742358 RepID=UPI002E248BC3